MNAGDLNGTKNPTDDERGRDEILLLLNRKVRTRRTGEQHRRRNDTREHRQGVLKAEQHSEDQRHLIVQAKEGASRAGAIAAADKGDVGPEEGGVVVGADEAVAGGDGVDETVVEGLLGRCPRENGVDVVHCQGYC